MSSIRFGTEANEPGRFPLSEPIIERLGSVMGDPAVSPVLDMERKKNMGQDWDLTIHTDGASRGNPGQAGIGIVVCGPDGEVVQQIAEYLGVETNNAAEYRALLRALEIARTMGAMKVKFYSDSELMVKQIRGEYKVKNANLQPLYRKAMEDLRQLSHYSIEHVRREFNKDADRLANLGIDQAKTLNGR